MRDGLLVFSDLHAHMHKRWSRRDDVTGNSRLTLALGAVDAVLDRALETGVDRVIFAGDMFDAKSRTPASVLGGAYLAFSRWVPYGIQALLIPGNHDLLERSGSRHALDVFRALPGFVVVDEPTVMEWCGLDVCVVPYREELQEEWFRSDGHGLLVAHGLVEGRCAIPHAMTAGESVPSGEWVRSSWTDRFALSVVGHVHDSGFYRDRGSPVLVPGCPYHDELDAEGKARGFWEVDLGSMEATLREVPGAPKIKSFLLAVGGPGPEFSPDEFSGHIVRLVPESPAVPPSVVAECSRMLREHGAEFVWEDSPLPMGDRGLIAPRVSVSVNSSPIEVLRKALGSGLIDLRGESLDDLCGLGETILKEVENPWNNQ